MTSADFTDISSQPQRSRLAVASLVLSVVPICSPIGAVLGVVALVRMRTNRMLTGALLAWVGIALSVIVTAATYGGAYALYVNIRDMVNRPIVAVEAAFAGDAETFRAQMCGPGAKATDAQVQAWAQGLTERFGPFRRVSMGTEPPANAPAPKGRQDTFQGAYVVTFEKARVPMSVRFEVPDNASERTDGYRIRRLSLEPEGEAAIVFPDAEPVPQ